MERSYIWNMKMIVTINREKLIVPLTRTIYRFYAYIKDYYNISGYQPFVDNNIIGESLWKELSDHSTIELRMTISMNLVATKKIFSCRGEAFRMEVIKIYIKDVNPFCISEGETIVHKLYRNNRSSDMMFFMYYFPYSKFWTDSNALLYYE